MVKQISIIIVSWNVKDHLEANLKKIFELSCPYSYEVFVVDNGSVDGTAAMVREQFPQVKLIQNDWDSGFAYANNQALRQATGEVALHLNPDMLLEPGTLAKTYELLMGDHSIGILGVRLTKADGTPIASVRRLPTFWSQLFILLKIAHWFPRTVRYYMYEDFDYSKSQDTDQVRGSYFAFRRELVDTIGYWDAGYHLWFEEVDYCQRVKKAGMRVYYYADVSCHDYIGRSFAQMKHYEKQKIFTASMVRYFQKWHPRYQAWILRFFRPAGLAAAYLADLIGA